MKNRSNEPRRAPRTPSAAPIRMTPEEKEAFIAQTEEFEGPSRREVRGPAKPREHEAGVIPS